MADLAHPKLAIFRRVFTGLSVISMALCLAVLILWWQSYYFYDLLLYSQVDARTNHFFWVESNEGSVNFGSHRSFRSRSMYKPGWQSERIPQTKTVVTGPYAEIWAVFGSQPALGTVSRLGIAIPHWLLALAFAFLPATRVISALRTRRRNRIGLCSACGYDLRASPGRCPECGAVGGRPEDRDRVD